MSHDYWLSMFQSGSARRSSIAHYLPVLFGFAASYRAPDIIELGTDIGESTTALLAAAYLTGGHLWSADINPDCQFAAEYVGLTRWTFLQGDSISPAVLGEMPHGCNLLFVDSSHTFEQTCAEIEHYLPRVRPGGVALFHDTDKPGTADRVREALDDTLPKFRLSWAEFPGECGLGVIKIPRAE